LRLSNQGATIERIAAYTGRSRVSIGRDFDRPQEHALEGLADLTAPGNPPRITEGVRAFLKEKLSEERTWNATELLEVLKERFGLQVTAEAIRQHLISMGYRWKRTRYVPSQPPETPKKSKKQKASFRG
jgi:transposase